jgi:WD40 repeat protein
MGRCPSPEQLASLLGERLGGAEADAVADHVQTCPGCQDALDELSRGGPVAPGPSPTLGQYATEPGADFLRRLGEFVPTVLPGGPAAPPAAGWPRVAGYEIEGELGRGGVGVVYLARHEGLGRLVALKMLLSGAHAGAADRARFRGEAESAARLQHPNIVQVFEVGEHDGHPYLALEYVAGGSLAQRLRGSPLPAGEAAALVEVLAHAVHAAHQRGVVHRDLKPANVLLTADGTPKVTDFGLAKRLDAATAHTQTGAVVGTPDYMAPEQAEGKAAGPAADTYALGAILYHLLTGRPPFPAATALETLVRLRGEEPVSPAALQPRLPRDVVTVCLKCLAKGPAGRYASAAELADDLGRFRAGVPVRARPVGALGRALRWGRRRPAVAGLLAALAGSLLAGFVTTLYYARVAAGRADVAEDLAGKYRLASERADRKARDVEAENLTGRKNLYAAHAVLVQRAWADRRLDTLLNLLDRQRPERTGGDDLRGFEWHYWHRLCHEDLFTLAAHDRHAQSVRFSPDGGRLLSAGGDGLKTWDGATGRPLSALPLGIVAAAALSGDGRLLAAERLSRDGRSLGVGVWEAASGRLLHSLPRAGRLGSLAISPDGRALALGSRDGDLTLWYPATGEERPVGKTWRDLMSPAAFSPDGKHLAAITEPRPNGPTVVTVWDTATGRPGPTLPGTNFQCVAYSPSGTRLARGDFQGRVFIHDLGQRRDVIAFQAHRPSVAVVRYAPWGRWFATAGPEGDVAVWDAWSGRPFRTFHGHTGRVTDLVFSPNCRRLATACEDGTLKVWEQRRPPNPLHVPLPDNVSQCAFSPDGRFVALACSDGSVRVRDAVTGGEAYRLSGHAGPALGVAFSPDGRRLASAGADGTVRLWDVAARAECRSLRGHAGRVRAVAFSPDGRLLASGGGPDAAGPGELKLWDVETGREVSSLAGHAAAVCGVAFAPDGRRLVAGDRRAVKWWAVESGREVSGPGGGAAFAARQSMTCLALSPDGRRLFTAHIDGPNKDGPLRAWGEQTGRELRTMRGHVQRVWSVAVSPDGRRVASSSNDGAVKLWDADTGEEVLSLPPIGRPMNGVAFSPDGHRLACVAQESLWIYDAAPAAARP